MVGGLHIQQLQSLYDARGSVIGLVDSSGKVERTFRYGPYGQNIKSEGTQTVPYPFGYKGAYRMPGGNTGKGNVPNSLVHFGERYYDPTTGRWDQQDGEDQIGSPLRLTDSSSLDLIRSTRAPRQGSRPDADIRASG